MNRVLLASTLMLCCVVGSLNVAPAQAAPASLRMPASPPPYRPRTPQPYQKDMLLVMPKAGMTDEEIVKACENDQCEVIGSVGGGAYRVVAIKTPKGKGVETEKLLKKDKNFFAVQRNYSHESSDLPCNDPEIFLQALVSR
jgi:hypothetical protein